MTKAAKSETRALKPTTQDTPAEGQAKKERKPRKPRDPNAKPREARTADGDLRKVHAYHSGKTENLRSELQKLNDKRAAAVAKLDVQIADVTAELTAAESALARITAVMGDRPELPFGEPENLGNPRDAEPVIDPHGMPSEPEADPNQMGA